MQISLTTTGRRSGRERAVTLYAWEDGDELLVVGSWGGSARDPDWAGNLRSHPTATITRGPESFEVTARELDGDPRARAWELVVDQFPLYATYQRKTSRRIPVFALARR
jgi:deazaflavin-dependent oxidoreductase (nitroreductase family)